MYRLSLRAWYKSIPKGSVIHHDDLTSPVVPARHEKIDCKDPPDPIQDDTKEHRVEYETSWDPAPTADTGSGDNNVRELVRDHECSKNTKEQHQPSFDRCTIHTQYSALTYKKIKSTSFAPRDPREHNTY
jgi:hypothetical protein